MLKSITANPEPKKGGAKHFPEDSIGDMLSKALVHAPDAGAEDKSEYDRILSLPREEREKAIDRLVKAHRFGAFGWKKKEA